MQALHAYIFQLTTSRGGRHFRHHRPSCPAIISTHDLTRRSTRVAFRKNWKIKSFNSRPHEEVDWRSIQKLCRQHISTHDLTKRSTQRLPVNQPCITFQLTTSRRGRLHGRNSNHHVPTISTHDLTKRSTCRVAAIDHNCYFNSRPRKEVDFLGGKLSTPSVPFQLTTSQGGRRGKINC